MFGEMTVMLKFVCGRRLRSRPCDSSHQQTLVLTRLSLPTSRDS